jgi:hypothetical protein
MAEGNQSVLSLGVFLIIIVAAILLLAFGVIDWTLIVPVILVLSGCLLLGLAASRPSANKYAPSGFYMLSSGWFLISLGGALYLLRFNFLYSIALVLLVLGAIAIAAGLRRK